MVKRDEARAAVELLFLSFLDSFTLAVSHFSKHSLGFHIHFLHF